DHNVGNLLERHRVVAQQPTLADLIAKAIEERDAIFVGEVHLALGDFPGREREGGKHEESADAKGQPLAGKLIERADEALDLKAAKEGGIAAPPIEETDPSVVEARIDPGINLEPIDQLAASIALEDIPHVAPTSRERNRCVSLAPPNLPPGCAH